MSKKTKIFVTLAFVVAGFYTLEVFLAVLHGKAGGPTAFKVLLAAACVYYGVKKLKGHWDQVAGWGK